MNHQAGSRNGAWICVIAVALVWASPTAARIDPDTIAGAWLFDEGRGDVVHDLSSNGNDGTFIKAPEWVPGQFGSALAFNGTDAYVEVPHHETLEMTDTLSIAAWVKKTRFGVDFILEKGGDWTTGETNYGLSIHVSNKLMLYFLFNGAWRGTPGVQDMEWHHYAAVAVNGEVNPTLYIDGEPQPIEFSDALPGVEVITLSPTERPLNIGAQIDPVATLVGKNIIDEVIIFDVALTDGDVVKLMQGVERALTVSASGSLAVTWGSIRRGR